MPSRFQSIRKRNWRNAGIVAPLANLCEGPPELHGGDYTMEGTNAATPLWMDLPLVRGKRRQRQRALAPLYLAASVPFGRHARDTQNKDQVRLDRDAHHQVPHTPT